MCSFCYNTQIHPDYSTSNVILLMSKQLNKFFSFPEGGPVLPPCHLGPYPTPLPRTATSINIVTVWRRYENTGLAARNCVTWHYY